MRAVDLGITLGGDGTVLHLASLFTEDVPLPPVVSFAMGTLGFLTPFDVDDFVSILNRVLDANSNHVFCTLRTRKRCEVLMYVQRLAGCCNLPLLSACAHNTRAEIIAGVQSASHSEQQILQPMHQSCCMCLDMRFCMMHSVMQCLPYVT